MVTLTLALAACEGRAPVTSTSDGAARADVPAGHDGRADAGAPDLPRPPAEPDGRSVGGSSDGHALVDAPALDTEAPDSPMGGDEGGSPTCGLRGLLCCEGGTCAHDGCCFRGRCLDSGSVCRDPSTGVTYGTCTAGRCPCGAQGQRCCPQSAYFNQPACAEGLACAGATGMATCQPCGGPGGPCCTEGLPCHDGGCCAGRTCVPKGSSCGLPNYEVCVDGNCQCGGSGQPCCRTGTACWTPGERCTVTNLGALVGESPQAVCRKCGEPGGPCCEHNACTPGCCVAVSSIADACVAPGESCGERLGNCNDRGNCGGCGAAGQPCCIGPGLAFCTTPATNCTGGVAGAYPISCALCGGLHQACCGPRSGEGGPYGGPGCDAGLSCQLVGDRAACERAP